MRPEELVYAIVLRWWFDRDREMELQFCIIITLHLRTSNVKAMIIAEVNPSIAAQFRATAAEDTTTEKYFRTIVGNTV